MSFLRIREVDNIMNQASLDIASGMSRKAVVPRYASRLEPYVITNWISRVMRVALEDRFGKKCRQLDACMPKKYKKKSAAEVVAEDMKIQVAEPAPHPGIFVEEPIPHSNVFRDILDSESPHSHWWS